ncbi:MAG: glycosyltransferase, partial [Chloroflexota bacterium]
IHNVQYQGHFAPEWLPTTVGPFPESVVFQETGIYPNMLGLGLIHAHTVGTVSPTYAQEMVTPEFAYGLAPLFARRHQPVEGILNGLDYDQFNPATDPLLKATFAAASLGRRAANKAELQRRAGLPPDPRVPLLGMVSRLADQKGLDILLPALERLLPGGGFQFVVLGTGDLRYQGELSRLASTHQDKLAAFFTFDDGLARLIYGGCDVFVMPSRFEPCGLGQLISMRYGAIPLVRRTGGLADTVTDLSPDLARGTGFVFTDYTPVALEATLRRAVDACARRAEWRRLQQRVMGLDFSWAASARKYEAVYLRMVAGRKPASA